MDSHHLKKNETNGKKKKNLRRSKNPTSGNMESELNLWTRRNERKCLGKKRDQVCAELNSLFSVHFHFILWSLSFPNVILTSHFSKQIRLSVDILTLFILSGVDTPLWSISRMLTFNLTSAQLAHHHTILSPNK